METKEMIVNEEVTTENATTSELAVANENLEDLSLAEIIVGATVSIGGTVLAVVGVKKGIPLLKRGIAKVGECYNDARAEREFIRETRRCYREARKGIKELAAQEQIAEESDKESEE